MKVYIAAKYARRELVQAYARELAKAGHERPSRGAEAGEGTAPQAALDDLEDIRASDALILIGEPRGSENKGGGRWVEFGYALARGTPCCAVLNIYDLGPHDCNGPGHETVFTALPGVVCVPMFKEALPWLAALDVPE